MQREAAEITEQAMVTGSEGTGEGVSHAAAVDADAASEVEPSGHFRIYLGAAPGVGKTYAMLSEGHRRRSRGTDVVIGSAEAYGRPLTEALINGLEVVPAGGSTTGEAAGRRWISTRSCEDGPRSPWSTSLPTRMRRGPAGTTSAGRTSWRSSVPESTSSRPSTSSTGRASPTRSKIGAKVRERVPDWVVRKADKIELVHSSPEQLRRRMLHGDIYPMEKVPQALTHFFRTDNLIALRELALRFVAEESDEELLEHLRRHQPGWRRPLDRRAAAAGGRPRCPLARDRR